MPRPDKVKKVEELTEYLKQAQAVYVFEITGVSANDMNDLRKKVKTASSKMLLKVSKNTLFRVALKNAGYPESDVVETGQNCFGFAFEDPVELAKIIVDFAKEFETVKKTFQEKGIEINDAMLTMIPQNHVPLEGKQAQKLLRLIEALEDHDDVQNVYANFDIPEETLEVIAESSS